MIENIKELEQTLRLQEGTLQAAIDAEDSIKLEIPELKIFTSEEYTTREANLETEKEGLKSTYKQVGVEMAVKEARNTLGYEFQGKTIENLLEAHGKTILEDANLKTDPKIASLQSDFDQMKSNFMAETEKVTGLNDQIQGIKDQSTINGSMILGDIDTSTLNSPKSDIDILYKHHHAIGINEGVSVMLLPNGDVMKDPVTLVPVSTTGHYQTWIKENHIKITTGGAGGDNSSGQGKEGTYDAFVEEMKGKGTSINSSDFQNEMSKRMAEGTLKI